jgi:amino acid adenylation domain-containing protein/FkbH-like protein/non-ribosomal peptide synthase protein (TIGR01720 family)
MDQASLQAKLGALTPEQREQLKRLLAAKREAEAAAKRGPTPARAGGEEIPRVPEAEDYAPSFAQKRLWMQEELSEGLSSAYNVPLAVILSGELNAAALEQAFRWVMEKHAVLRTRIVRRGDEPRQVVVAVPEWALERWPAGAAGTSRAEFRDRAEALANQPFALDRELPFRAALMPLGPKQHGLALVFHHIACDGRSVATLIEELDHCYAKIVRGETLPAVEAKVRYVDYAAWHRAWLESPAGAKARAFWQRQFAEIPEPIELPGDKPRPSVQDFSGAHLHRRLAPGVRERLTQLGQRVGASLFGTLLATVVTFLHRYTGRDDITIGSPTEGRPHPDLEQIVGFFVNTLPLRTKVTAADPFLKVVERVRDGVLDALEHQGCPFDVMVQSLPLERDLSRPPLFTVMLGLTRAQEEAFRLPGLSAEVVPLGLRSSKVDLTFHFVETADGLELDLEFATALFTAHRMERLVDCFETMLQAALAAPASAIGDLGLLTPAQARDWAKVANPPRAEYPRDRSLAYLFREQVARNPAAPAVLYGGVTYSYAELDRLSDAIAGHLVGRLGALRADEPIALQVDRSERMLAALLGILKAGGCYLPINPGTPAERVRTLLTMSGARLRLVEGEPAVSDWMGSDVDLRLCCAKPPPVTASSGVGEGGGAGRRLAYIIFTSGSTGEPKGVLIEQHSVVRLVRSTDFLQLGPGDRVLQTGSLAFDASTFEIWGPLLNGGCCCLPQGKEILEIDQFDALLKSTGATTCFLTTGLFNQIADFHPQAFRGLRHLLTGGEKVSVPHVNRVMAAAPSLTLLHVYGPTENTTFSTWYHVKGERQHDVPIGRPIAHSTLYILDERGNLQPPGVAGEIYCGGDGLARGYLGRPEATAERFVPDPFSERPGARLYRTGDFGRWDEAGNVEFSGRKDDQVKIRGFRIELGEVELRLRAQPGVQQAVVVARPSGGTHELVAYLVSSGAVSEDALRAGLKDVLPDYMVPGSFVFLEALPLNASGKVNRKALPAPKPAQVEATGPAEGKFFDDPKEQVLAAVWTEVLGRVPQSADAHYFNSGGDSIKAIQMTARLRAQGYRLTLREVFARPRFADLAAALVVTDTVEKDGGVEIGEVPLTPIQRWFLESFQPPYDHFNQATLLQSDERLQPELLRKALERLVARHGMLRCRLERAETPVGWKQTVPAGAGEVAWHEGDLRTETPEGARVALEAAAGELQRRLSLTDGRLVAAGFFRTAKADRLLLVIHHWAVDGISWRILLEELETIYRSLVAEMPEPKLATPASFRAWSQNLVAYAQSEALAKEARMWDALMQRLPVTAVPPELAAVERRELVFSTEVTNRLLSEAHRAYGTQVEELLLAAFGKAWADNGGGDAVALAMEGHGRESCVGPVDISSTVGWFTSLWPFLLTGSGGWSERIRAVKDALRSVPERGVGYGIQRYLRTGAAGGAEGARVGEAARTPRVSFNYLGVFTPAAGSLFRGVVDEATGEPVAAHLGSPFDLDVVGEVSGGALRVSFHFHRSAGDATQRSELVKAFGRALEDVVVEGCAAKPVRSLTDFTGGLASLGELDRLVQRCAERGLEAEDILPLTPMQEGMVFHALYEPESPAYSDQVVLELRGPLEAKTFEAAWQALGQQYPNLRTIFFTGETERPVGVIPRGTRLGFDWVESADTAQQEALRATERARGFALETGPLLRLTLVRLGADWHEAILGFHHSILDGWSSGLIWQRLEENYRALAAGKALPPVRAAFTDFLRWLSARDAARDLAGWTTMLAGCPVGAAIPTGAPRLGAPAIRTRSFNWELGLARTDLLVTSARRLGTTENSLFQTLWGIFLGKLTRSSDVVFGATVSGRTEGIPRVEEIVGLMINTIPVRVTWAEETSFQELAERVRVQSAEGMERLAVSLADIESAAGSAGPIVRHTLVFENYPTSEGDEAAKTLWRMETVAVHDPMHFELGVLVVPKRDGWVCRVVADAARYPDAYLRTLQQAWHEVVDHCLAMPEGRIDGWEPKQGAGRLRRITVAATFTAEPLQDTLRFWLDGRGEETELRFAPFNQVLQQLLDPGSELLRSRSELNVLLVRLEDWAGPRRDEADKIEEALDLNADHFVDGLQRLVQTVPAGRHLVLFCPMSPEARAHAALGEAIAAAERRLIRRLDVPRLRPVRTVGSRELSARFPGVAVDNLTGEHLGGVPYAEEFFAVLATEVIRRWDGLTRAPLKVLALDADNTLWRGVLGEDGAAGITLTPGHRRLQDVAKAAQAGGMLLVLVSKNNVEELKETFQRRPDFPLKWEDFVAVEAGWRPKSESLRALAKGLKLGLDSFVFLDDSSLECAEVSAALPEVLILQVPAEAEAVEAFAGHLWPADVFAASAEDRQRSELYRVEARREQTRQSSGGLKDFIQQLQLEVGFVAVNEENIERAAQLTQRTNQFNASTVRRSAADVREFLGRAGNRGFLLEVKDRFGDYGITGLVLYRDEGKSRTVDTLLLSCRVLGRGVEHELLRRLAREAQAAGLPMIRVGFVRSGKNVPAEQFLRACAGHEETGGHSEGGVTWFVYDSEAASRVEIADEAGAGAEEASAETKTEVKDAPVARGGGMAASYFYQTVATEFASVAKLMAAVEAAKKRGRQRHADVPYEEPQEGDEGLIAEIWAAVLGVERVGRKDDFFGLGGHSLKAVMMLSRVNRALGAELLLEAIFAAPVLADFAAAVGRSGRGRELGQAISRAPVAADYPLSNAQRRLWLIEQMRAEAPSPFHMPAVFRLDGKLDETRLAEAFHRLIARHESLRTALVLVGAEPRQRVLANVQFGIETPYENGLAEFIERDFDLARPPLLRVGLQRHNGQGWTMAVVMHHAISDGWSIGVMAEELSAFYRDAAFSPAPLAVHYKDYAAWQDRQLAEGRWQRAAEYWQTLLKNLPSPLELPADRGRPAIKQSLGAEVAMTLPAAAWAVLKGQAQRAGASPFVALMAVLQVLVSRQGRTSRFVIGTPVAGRDQPELEPQIGFFVNLLAIVAEVEGGRTFAEHLSAVKATVTAALSHAVYPFDRLVTDLNLPRDMSRSPLFDLLMVFQSNRSGELSLGDVQVTEQAWKTQTSQYDVTFEFAETNDGLHLRLEYDRALFDEGRISRMGRQFFALLENAFATPARPVEALEICPREETDLIRSFERGGRFDTYRASTIPALVAAAGQSNPEHSALMVGDRTMTYAALVRRAGDIAEAVRAAGAARQELVVVAGERAEEFVCAMLGVMQAGCVYVPLDLKHPDERLRMVLEDGGVNLGIAVGPMAEKRLAGLGLALISRDTAAAKPRGAAVDEAPLAESDLAYVIFTSGSTGRPKGVEIEHGSFATMIESQVEVFGVRRDDRCAWWASCAFDASLSEIFLALTTGATVVIAEETEREDPAAFLTWLKARHVTVITLPPAFLRVLQRASLEPVRVLITAGEAADTADSLHYARSTETFNAYGPTETSVCATVQRVSAEAKYGRVIPIGRPLDVASAYVLDGQRRRVPVGVPGELFVGGQIVGRGYRGAPGPTAERFLVDPFTERAGARMYRTGDLVRWREDGTLEFIGREDGQVKIRGFRIELGEVESALRQIAGVRAVAVLAVERQGSPSLVAYVAVDGLGLDDLSTAVASRLPDYMRPAAYGRVERLPMTPNGKLDKAALPAPDWAEQAVVTPPETERERALAQAWEACLGVERVGRESNFFALGGDSIKALSLAAKLRGAGWVLGLKVVFAHPELREQALQMQVAPARETRTVSGVVTLTPIQKWFLEQHAAGPLHHFNQALFYRVAERLDAARLQHAVQAVWTRHAGLRATFTEEGGNWRQYILPPNSSAPEVRWLEVTDGQDKAPTVAAWVQEMQTGLRLSTGPLVRYGVIREAAGDRVLCVTHHLVSDWVSHRILMEDLETAYVGEGSIRTALPPAVTELDEWTQAGARWAAEGTPRTELVEFWQAMARACPVDATRERVGRYGDVTVLGRQMDAARTAKLRAVLAGRGSGAVRDAILAALVQAEGRVLGSDRVAVQLEGHGRDGWGAALDVSRTVGWFTSLYPCVLTPQPEEETTVAQVSATLSALPEGGSTYSLLREYGPVGAAAAVGTQIGFNYLGEFAAPTGPGLFQLDGEMPQGAIASDFPRDHPLDVTAWIFAGELNVHCAFVGDATRSAVMTRWLEQVMEFLNTLAGQ